MGAVMIGPLGGLREIPEVQRGMGVAVERPTSTFQSLGGRRVVQKAPRAPRTWSADLGQWRTPEQVAWVQALATGAVPGPHYLYTQDAAQTNLLPADIAAPGALGASGLLMPGGVTPPRDRVSVLIAGAMVLATGVWGDPSAPGDWSQTIPLPPGSYVLSGYRTTTGQALLWRTVNAAGAAVATGTLTSSGGARGTSNVTVSGAAVGLQVRLPILTSGAVVGGFRLTAGTSQSADWMPGRGVPEVSVSDPAETQQYAGRDGVRSDYTVTLMEVG